MTDSIEKQKQILGRIEEFKEILESRGKLSDEDKKIIFAKYVELALAGSNSSQNISSPLHSNPVLKSNLFSDATFAELVRKTKLKKHSDLVLLALYDLMVNKEYKSVTTAEITEQYKSALLKPSENTSADIRYLRGKGFMMPGDNKEGKMSFKITMSGIEYMEGALKNVN